MKFISTRGKSPAVTAAEAIRRGLAPDGGLYVPDELPVFSASELEALYALPYAELSAAVLERFLPGFSREELLDYTKKAYASFDDDAVVPLHALGDKLWTMELFHGPTCAFKDVALQILPYLLAASVRKCADDHTVAILVATSGDTGKAALEGFADVPGTKIAVFYPDGGVSDIQRAQMATQGGNNVLVLAVRGNFDDAQTGVKRLFSSAEFREKMNAMGKLPSSANSINFGRLAPQIVYYFNAYTQLVQKHSIRMGQSVNFVVPTGNFGDILAGYYAMRMGLPIARLLCASNRNNVLTDFFADGTYYTHRAFFQTMSPSMDILISSNLERLLFESTGRDPALVREWMALLSSEGGSFSIGAQRLKELKKTFWAGYADDFMTAAEIRRIFERFHYLMDPHTAVASYALKQYREETGDHTPAVILSTASPYKFSESVLASLQGEDAVKGMDAFQCAQKLEELSGVPVPRQIRELETLPIRHKRVCEVSGMEDALMEEWK